MLKVSFSIMEECARDFLDLGRTLAAAEEQLEDVALVLGSMTAYKRQTSRLTVQQERLFEQRSSLKILVDTLDAAGRSYQICESKIADAGIKEVTTYL